MKYFGQIGYYSQRLWIALWAVLFLQGCPEGGAPGGASSEINSGQRQWQGKSATQVREELGLPPDDGSDLASEDDQNVAEDFAAKIAGHNSAISKVIGPKFDVDQVDAKTSSDGRTLKKLTVETEEGTFDVDTLQKMRSDLSFGIAEGFSQDPYCPNQAGAKRVSYGDYTLRPGTKYTAYVCQEAVDRNPISIAKEVTEAIKVQAKIAVAVPEPVAAPLAEDEVVDEEASALVGEFEEPVFEESLVDDAVEDAAIAVASIEEPVIEEAVYSEDYLSLEDTEQSDDNSGIVAADVDSSTSTNDEESDVVEIADAEPSDIGLADEEAGQSAWEAGEDELLVADPQSESEATESMESALVPASPDQVADRVSLERSTKVVMVAKVFYTAAAKPEIISAEPSAVEIGGVNLVFNTGGNPLAETEYGLWVETKGHKGWYDPLTKSIALQRDMGPGKKPRGIEKWFRATKKLGIHVVPDEENQLAVLIKLIPGHDYSMQLRARSPAGVASKKSVAVSAQTLGKIAFQKARHAHLAKATKVAKTSADYGVLIDSTDEMISSLREQVKEARLDNKTAQANDEEAPENSGEVDKLTGSMEKGKKAKEDMEKKRRGLNRDVLKKLKADQLKKEQEAEKKKLAAAAEAEKKKKKVARADSSKKKKKKVARADSSKKKKKKVARADSSKKKKKKKSSRSKI